MKWLSFLKRNTSDDTPTHGWEYFGRMKYTSDLIKSIDIKNPTVLDIGGVPGGGLLKRFGIEDVTTLDLSEGADIIASAENIPLKNNSFDVVTCIDTLEHIPRQHRLKAVDEMIRIAAFAVIIVAPQNTDENNLAEQIVLKHCEVGFLEEHQEMGLVDFDQIEQRLNQHHEDGLIKAYSRTEMDDLLNWVNMMTRDVKNGSAIYLEAYTLENRFCPRRIGLHIRLQ